MPSPTYLPGPAARTVRTHAGQTLPVPAGWNLLLPGDAALTRRVKAAGDHWLVQVAYRESRRSRSAALKREAAIKRLHRRAKLELVGTTNPSR